jgi:hypothetical protein
VSIDLLDEAFCSKTRAEKKAVTRSAIAFVLAMVFALGKARAAAAITRADRPSAPKVRARACVRPRCCCGTRALFSTNTTTP